MYDATSYILIPKCLLVDRLLCQVWLSLSFRLESYKGRRWIQCYRAPENSSGNMVKNIVRIKIKLLI